MSNDIHEAIRTKELRLVDNSGQDKAVLSADADGAVSINFLDGSEAPRVRLGISKEGQAVLQLGRGVGAPNITLSLEKDGRFVMEGRDNEGVERFKLELTGNGSHTQLSFSEKYRHPRMIIMAEDKGPAGLFILDQHGKALFSTTP